MTGGYMYEKGTDQTTSAGAGYYCCPTKKFIEKSESHPDLAQ